MPTPVRHNYEVRTLAELNIDIGMPVVCMYGGVVALQAVFTNTVRCHRCRCNTVTYAEKYWEGYVP